MFCPKCNKESEIVLSDSGPHIKASCLDGHYIKFLPLTELTGEKTMSDFEVNIESDRPLDTI